jgi:hypothetical protein
MVLGLDLGWIFVVFLSPFSSSSFINHSTIITVLRQNGLLFLMAADV